MAALNYNETTFNDMIATIIADADYSGTEHQNLMGDLERGLANSRLVPAWDRHIDVALKLLIVGWMQQVIDVADAVVLCKDFVDVMLEQNSSNVEIVRAIRKTLKDTTGTDCGLLTAIRVMNFVSYKRELRHER